jgi:hypothetical protein
MKSWSLAAAVMVGVFCSEFPVALAQDQPTMHAPDGGTRERLESLTILPTTNAPFTATVTTEWMKILVDGSKQTNWNHRTIARDSSGRIFQERRFFTPNGDKVATLITELDYADPNRHELYVCMPQQKTCYLHPYYAPQFVNLPPTGPQPQGRSEITREELGRKTVEDVDVLGSREITTINAGAMGNERAEPIVKEFWYSPKLGINVITKRFDPRSGAQNFVVSNINQSEPDPKMFEPPAGFNVVNMIPQNASAR